MEASGSHFTLSDHSPERAAVRVCISGAGSGALEVDWPCAVGPELVKQIAAKPTIPITTEPVLNVAPMKTLPFRCRRAQTTSTVQADYAIHNSVAYDVLPRSCRAVRAFLKYSKTG
jgi:hypothetical protein